jgi:hypothetical protein
MSPALPVQAEQEAQAVMAQPVVTLSHQADLTAEQAVRAARSLPAARQALLMPAA